MMAEELQVSWHQALPVVGEREELESDLQEELESDWREELESDLQEELENDWRGELESDLQGEQDEQELGSDLQGEHGEQEYLVVLVEKERLYVHHLREEG